MSKENKQIVKEVQNIVYRILCDVDEFCTDKGLQYYLSGGTCLGAVRHHGFIPWDDDADIMLPRKDYEIFLKAFEGAYKGKYQVGSLYNDEEWRRPAARVWDLDTELLQVNAEERKMGIFIDVFPIDGLPESHFKQRMLFAKIKVIDVLRNVIKRKGFYKNEKFIGIKKILGVLMKPFPASGARWFAERLDKLAKHYDFSTSKYVAASMAVHYGRKEIIERECMETGIRIPFESREFPVPVGYDKYLTNLYGDYMMIPKEAAEKGYEHLEGWIINLNVHNDDIGGVMQPLDTCLVCAISEEVRIMTKVVIFSFGGIGKWQTLRLSLPEVPAHGCIRTSRSSS